MEKVYLILGYGVPKQIEKDLNYNIYIGLVFNYIYSSAQVATVKSPLIIFCGGFTDIFPPFKRDEARQMQNLFKLLAGRRFVRKITIGWRYLIENKSLSTLENLLYSRDIIRKRKIKKAQFTIFCEASRLKKVTTLARRIFGKSAKIKVEGIDFDLSQNRYLDSEFIEKKEKQELKFALWSLSCPENLKKHHQVLQERLHFFRQQGPAKHGQAIGQWWTLKLKELNVK